MKSRLRMCYEFNEAKASEMEMSCFLRINELDFKKLLNTLFKIEPFHNFF